MIAKLDYHVWELACRQLHIWKNEGFEERSVSVNISAKDFYLADLYESITGLVERY
jgi:EAL domain-containing protein (putative c-di-GMP-specific phosphodiesterase class I)